MIQFQRNELSEKLHLGKFEENLKNKSYRSTYINTELPFRRLAASTVFNKTSPS